jgi:plasmid stabilization system protein ParE
MSYRVLVLDRAQRDADSIAAWLFKRSPIGALRWFLAFEVAKEKLSQDPLSYALAPEDGHFDFDLRQILFKTPHGKRYRALFTVDGDEVRILRVRGPHQRLIRKRDLPDA